MPEYMRVNNETRNLKIKLLNKYLNQIILMTISFWLLLILLRPVVLDIYMFSNEGSFIYNFVISIAAMTLITSIPGFHLNSLFRYKLLFIVNILALALILIVFQIQGIDLKMKFFIYLLITFLLNFFLIIYNFSDYGKSILIKTFCSSFIIILYNILFIYL